jgi:hypothetical protein
MHLPWFRMYAEAAADPVLQSLSFDDQRHYYTLLCLKCGGTIDRDLPANRRDQIIARGLGLDPATAAEAKRRLLEVGLIDKNWQPKGWDKRQFRSDSSTERTRKYRNLNESGNVPETSPSRHRDVQNRTEQSRTEELQKKARFIKPTLEQVVAYCVSRGNLVDATAWFNHYETVGWKVGKNALPMVDWQAAIRTWEKPKRGTNGKSRQDDSAVSRVRRANQLGEREPIEGSATVVD